MDTSTSEVKFRPTDDCEHGVPIPEAWNQLRLENVVCDGIIGSSDGCTFPVHRVIVCSASEKLCQLFITESESGTEEVTDVSVPAPGRVLKLLVEYIYTGTCVLSVPDARNLLHVARNYEVNNLVRACCRFLENQMTIKNCLETQKVAAELRLFELESKTLRFIRYNFSEILESTTDTWTLDTETLYNIMSSDHLNVGDEMTVFNAIIQWAEYDSETRALSLQNLIAMCPRYGLLDPQQLDDIILNDKYVRQSEMLCNKVESISEHLKTIQRERLNNDIPNENYYDFDVSRPRIPGDIIFAIGGWSEEAPTNFMETYDSRTDRWYPTNFIDSLARAYHGICVLKKIIYVIGGHDGRDYFNSVKCYDPEKHEWSERACMYHARSYVSVCVAAGKIYALGGNDGRHRLSSAERYDPSMNQWEMIQNMQSTRSDASAASLNGKVYVAGGFNGRDILTSVEMYDPGTDKWTYIQEMNTPRSGLKVIAHKGFLYAFGGFGGFQRLESAEILHLENSDSWSEICPLHYSRSNFGAVVLDNRIYAIGGYDGFTTIPYVECYDIRDNQWDVVKNMNLHRSAVAACVVSNFSNACEYSFLKDENQVSENINDGS